MEHYTHTRDEEIQQVLELVAVLQEGMLIQSARIDALEVVLGKTCSFSSGKHEQASRFEVLERTIAFQQRFLASRSRPMNTSTSSMHIEALEGVFKELANLETEAFVSGGDADDGIMGSNTLRHVDGNAAANGREHQGEHIGKSDVNHGFPERVEYCRSTKAGCEDEMESKYENAEDYITFHSAATPSPRSSSSIPEGAAEKESKDENVQDLVVINVIDNFSSPARNEIEGEPVVVITSSKASCGAASAEQSVEMESKPDGTADSVADEENPVLVKVEQSSSSRKENVNEDHFFVSVIVSPARYNNELDENPVAVCTTPVSSRLLHLKTQKAPATIPTSNGLESVVVDPDESEEHDSKVLDVDVEKVSWSSDTERYDDIESMVIGSMATITNTTAVSTRCKWMRLLELLEENEAYKVELSNQFKVLADLNETDTDGEELDMLTTTTSVVSTRFKWMKLLELIEEKEASKIEASNRFEVLADLNETDTDGEELDTMPAQTKDVISTRSKWIRLLECMEEREASNIEVSNRFEVLADLNETDTDEESDMTSANTNVVSTRFKWMRLLELLEEKEASKIELSNRFDVLADLNESDTDGEELDMLTTQTQAVVSTRFTWMRLLELLKEKEASKIELSNRFEVLADLNEMDTLF